jgi:hypothetical protein
MDGEKMNLLIHPVFVRFLIFDFLGGEGSLVVTTVGDNSWGLKSSARAPSGTTATESICNVGIYPGNSQWKTQRDPASFRYETNGVDQGPKCFHVLVRQPAHKVKCEPRQGQVPCGQGARTGEVKLLKNHPWATFKCLKVIELERTAMYAEGRSEGARQSGFVPPLCAVTKGELGGQRVRGTRGRVGQNSI